MLGRGGWQACPHVPPPADSVTHRGGVVSSHVVWDAGRSAHSQGSWAVFFPHAEGDKMNYNRLGGGSLVLLLSPIFGWSM